MNRVALATTATAFIILGGGGFVAAQSWEAAEQTVVRVRVPAGTASLYVYRGSGPGSMSSWEHCFALDGVAEVMAPSVLASPGERQWNFLAYPAVGCADGAVGPLATATHITAPRDLSTWSVTLR